MTVRERIVDATLELLADRRWEEVTLRAIAERTDLSLAELAATFSSRGAILAAYTESVDQQVLAAGFADMADEVPRDRLFDVLMSRIEVLRQHPGAVRELLRAARRDTQLALFLNGLTVRGMRWMMEAAAITPQGVKGAFAVQRLAIAFARVLRIAVDEEDVGMPRTMAALDKELRELEERHRRAARFFGSAVRAAAPASPPPGAAGKPTSDDPGDDGPPPTGPLDPDDGPPPAPMADDASSAAPAPEPTIPRHVPIESVSDGEAVSTPTDRRGDDASDVEPR